MAIRILLICFVFMLAGGCSTMSVSVDHDASANFAQLKTYQWRPATKTGNPRIDNNTLLESRIKNAVDRELGQKGYQRLAEGTPDFLIGYHVTLDQKQAGEVINDSYGYSGWWGRYDDVPVPEAQPSHTYIYEYNEGTLLIDMSSPETKQLLWRGSATDRVNFQASPEEKEKAINAAVKKMLQQFPPK